MVLAVKLRRCAPRASPRRRKRARNPRMTQGAERFRDWSLHPTRTRGRGRAGFWFRDISYCGPPVTALYCFSHLLAGSCQMAHHGPKGHVERFSYLGILESAMALSKRTDRSFSESVFRALRSI